MKDINHEHVHSHEHKTKWVVILASLTMVVEIVVGLKSNSMALMAEGWHMASHVFVIGLSWIAYIIARRYSESEHLSFQKEKLLSLSGFTSAIILLVVAVIMVIESVERLLNPVPIKFAEAIIVASIGLLVNTISATMLHHDSDNSDHNIRAAYVHVFADGITSLMALVALIIGMFFDLYFLDDISGIIGSIVISYWALSLIKNSGAALIDFKRKK